MRQSLQGLAFFAGLAISCSSHAWFIWIPTGAIARALETDPDSVPVSNADRLLGKCAGFHINQAQKFAVSTGTYPGDSQVGAAAAQVQQTPQSSFHEEMANAAVARAQEQDKVKTLGNAYSVRWGRVAGADRQANLAYGADLARGCQSNGIAVNFAHWQAQRDEAKRTEERRRVQAEEDLKRARAEDEAKKAVITSAPIPVQTSSSASPPSSSGIDFGAEATKSARILGCTATDVKVTGTDGKNILFSAACDSGQPLHLTCDQQGLCLKRQ
jgi:hypothetical protein